MGEEIERERSVEAKVGLNLGVASASVSRRVARKWKERVDEIPAEAAAHAGVSVAEFFERVESNDQLQDMLFRAMMSAASSSVAAKRRALARAVANGLLASDDAQIDKWGVALSALDRLDAVHLRVLQHLVTRRAELDDFDPVSNSAVSATDLGKSLQSDADVLMSVLQTLEGLGLAAPANYVSEQGQGHRIGTNMLWVTTVLGERIIELCGRIATHDD